MATTTVSREQILSLLPTTPTALDCDIITPENLERLIDPGKIEDVSRKVLMGRQAREYILAQERRVSSLSILCRTVFYSYLPEAMRTEALREIFNTKYHRLDPETRINMYETWLAALPYRAFSHLTTMVIDIGDQRNGPILPPEIARFSHLTRLGFSPFSSTIPADITKLPNLTTLDLRCYSGDLDNLRNTCRGLPQLREIIFDEDFKRTRYLDFLILQQEFPQIKIEFQKIPPRTWSPL